MFTHLFFLLFTVAPQGPPEIDYNNKTAYYAGDKLIMTCTVNGGNPLVDRVNFGCGEREIPNKGSNSRHPTSVSQTLTFELTNADHELQCQCSATHLTDTYSLTKTIRLDVKDRKTTLLVFFSCSILLSFVASTHACSYVQ